jgi:diadenosine tetraphosphate (Ap4A) HIT family hydrolase
VNCDASRDCFLCQGQFETPVIRESTLWLTFINRNQALLGKTIIALRRHEEEVDSIAPEEWVELRHEVGWVTERLRRAFAPDHFNYSFLMNADRHVHLHVIPRYVGTRDLAGVEFTDPDYPDSYQTAPGPTEIADPAVIGAVEAALRSS